MSLNEPRGFRRNNGETRIHEDFRGPVTEKPIAGHLMLHELPRTLISFLGTGEYSETTYRWPDGREHRTSFVAEALAKLWAADCVVVLATRAAEEKNGEGLRRGLEAAGIREVAFHRLSDGRTDDELWTQFQAIREAIEHAAGGDILIDITHGYRAQPFFAGAVLSVLRAAGVEAASLTLVYGEYREREPVSPIWDLTLFVELIDWAQALSLFLRTGVAEPVVQLGERVRRREALRANASNTREFPRFRALTSAIEEFAADLSTIRVASIITGYKHDNREASSACGSAARLLAAIDACRPEAIAKLPPLGLILDKLAEQLRPLTAERLFGADGQRAQYALARHYLALTRYPEAAVVVREARVSLHAPNAQAAEVNSPDFDPEQRGAADSAFSEQDSRAREIAEIRNDIEHGGFRKQPLPARALQKRLARLIDSIASEENAAQHASRESTAAPGRAFFVTRHPGAAEWASRQGIPIDRVVDHLDLADVRPGDMVIGTLPVHLAAEVCARCARYFHLTVDLPSERRGVELTADELTQLGARLVEYQAKEVRRRRD